MDSAQRSLAVYHVDGGNLQLQRQKHGMGSSDGEFNGTPLPSELRRVHP